MTTAEPSILYALSGDVAEITLNRPEQLNAVDYDMLLALPQLLTRAVDDGARAILLTGSGRAFCSGATLSADRLKDCRDLGEIVDTYYNPLARSMASLPIPLVTAINGPAAGAGASLALWGDIILAARSSYLLFAFANIGLVPDAGGTWLLAKSVGRTKALEIALLSEKVPAEAALAAGLVTKVIDDEDLLPAARALAARLAARPTLAMSLIRGQIQAALDGDLEAALLEERNNQRTAGASEDFGEGVRAFIDKRKPVFKGR
jgi:2-(1,2-epoxy-1,2-dihydrophenyl)acetyl-CoA isomerase